MLFWICNPPIGIPNSRALARTPGRQNPIGEPPDTPAGRLSLDGVAKLVHGLDSMTPKL
jgi:hypothetical protein